MKNLEGKINSGKDKKNRSVGRGREQEAVKPVQSGLFLKKIASVCSLYIFLNGPTIYRAGIMMKE